MSTAELLKKLYKSESDLESIFIVSVVGVGAFIAIKDWQGKVNNNINMQNQAQTSDLMQFDKVEERIYQALAIHFYNP